MQAGVVGWVNVNEVQVLEYTSSAVNTLSKYYVKMAEYIMELVLIW